MNALASLGTRPRQRQLARALRQIQLTGSARSFQGSADQVREVRRFVRAEIGQHPALDDVVMVASELAANAITHTASGQDGGVVVVHLAKVGPDHVAVLVTDRGWPGQPQARGAGDTNESGRGLAVVTKLSRLVLPLANDIVHTVLAVVPADPEPPCQDQ